MTHTACLMCPLFQAMNEYECMLIDTDGKYIEHTQLEIKIYCTFLICFSFTRNLYADI